VTEHFKGNFLALHNLRSHLPKATALHLELKILIMLLLTQNQHFNCVNMILQLQYTSVLCRLRTKKRWSLVAF